MQKKKKHILRRQCIEQLSAMKEDIVLQHSRVICAYLQTSHFLRDIKHIAIYAAMNNEVDLSLFFEVATRRKLKIYFPKFYPKKQQYRLARVDDQYRNLAKGFMDIYEPTACCPFADKKTVDDEMVWLIPGIAFDMQGNRLGRGKGYYDAMLKEKRGRKIAIAHHWQVTGHIPVDHWDIQVDDIVTEKEWIHCS